MQSKLCVVLLALGLSQILAVPAPYLALTHPETSLMQVMMQSRDLASDALHSQDCINYYVPLLSAAVEKYNTDLKACLDDAAAQQEAINVVSEENRSKFDQSATSSCAALEVCQKLTGAIEYFECYTEAGSTNAKSMFTISADASEELVAFREEVRLIEYNEYLCTNKTQRTYAEDTADLYESLSLCMAGSPIPTETSSTAAPQTSSSLDPESSTDSSSAEPESSSTAEPESSSSAAPESSTDSSSAEPESSSSAAPESSTDSSSAEPESSSSAAPESSTDSSSAEPESSSSAASTDSSSAEPESSTSAAPDAPEEDLKQIFTGTSNKNLQDILKNLQSYFKSQ